MGHDGVASGYTTPTGFRRLTSCQRDPRDRGVTLFLIFVSLFSCFILPLDTWLNVSHSHKCTTCYSMCPSPNVPCGIHRIMPQPDASKNMKF